MGYSRAVKIGNQIWVSGTTATDNSGNIVGKGDAAAQTRQIIANITSALAAAGARLSDVVRTRIFVTDMTQWEAIGRAHGEAFRRHPAGRDDGRSATVDRSGPAGRDRGRSRYLAVAMIAEHAQPKDLTPHGVRR